MRRHKLPEDTFESKEYSDSTMRCIHMIVNVTGLKDPHTRPADMSLTGGACHMIAAVHFLHVHTAARTWPDVILFLPLHVGPFVRVALRSSFGTGEAWVSLDSTCRTNVRQTAFALKNRTFWPWPVDMCAFDSGAEPVIFWVFLDVGFCSTVKKPVHCRGAESRLDDA